MYTSRTGLVLGFHGTCETIINDLLNGSTDLEPSTNDYDWLGNGIYFWDNSPSRAENWAKEQVARGNTKIKKPAVIGAIIDLGYCLDLLDYKNNSLLNIGYNSLVHNTNLLGKPLPVNKGKSSDLVLRELDCAVIESLHFARNKMGERSFDSVRGVFWEGDPLYEGAKFMEKNHIQICVRDVNCIKGYFKPLTRISN